MECFSFKDRCAMHIVKLTKTIESRWCKVQRQMACGVTGRIPTYYNFYKYQRTLVLSRLNQRIKFVCIAMCSLVMSLCYVMSLQLGLCQICQHNKKHNGLACYASIMLNTIFSNRTVRILNNL